MDALLHSREIVVSDLLVRASSVESSVAKKS